MKTTKHYLVLFSFIICSFNLSAHDHLNLERGLPVQMEDAYPTAYMNREIQGIFHYEELPDGDDQYVATPVLEYGLIRNGEVEIGVPVRFGSEEEQKSGDINLGGLYNFFYEGLYLPAPALSFQATLPTGKHSEGVDTRTSLIFTKTLSRSTYFHRLHLNLFWFNNAKAGKEERLQRYEFALGYQMRLNQNNQLLLNALQREEEMKRKESTILEVGIRHQWNPLWVLSAGIGAGVSSEAPDFTATIGFQKALNF